VHQHWGVLGVPLARSSSNMHVAEEIKLEA